MKVLGLTIAIIALALFGLALRIIFIKGGEFRGSCASNNPMLKNEIGECTVCGAKPEEECKS
jgi:hypothetical protein